MKNLLCRILVSAAVSAASPVVAQEVDFVSWAYAEATPRPFIEAQVGEIENVDVNLVGFPWNQMVQNLVLRHRSGQTTEVAQVQDRWMPMLVGLNALADLNGVFGEDVLEETIEPSLLAMGQVDGQQFGVPWTAASIAMVANLDTLARAGVDEVPETMDAFYNSLVAIRDNVPNSVPFGLSTTNPNLIQVESQIIFWQYGARFFNEGEVAIDSDEAREALAFLVRLVDEGLIAKGNDRNATRNLFGQGLVGFYFDPPVARGNARRLSGQGEAYDQFVTPMPTPNIGNGEPARSVIWAHFLTSMTAGSPDIDGARELISHFALTPETQVAYWNALGLFPTTKVALEQIGDDPYVTDWIELTGTALPDEPSAFENSAELRQIIGEEIEAALLGVKDVDAAITDMASRLNDAL